MKTISADILKYIIKIETQETSRGDFGETSIKWVTKYNKVYAHFTPLSSKELLLNAQLQKETTCRFLIRHRDDINEGDRIIFKNKIYDIKGVIEDNETQKEWLTIECSQGLNNG